MAARRYSYAQLDVFTNRPLTGNQLAVFLDPEGLTIEEMMLMTREMGFSESTFVYPPAAKGTPYRVRIFGLNTSAELPVAGHPTVGTVFALASRKRIRAGEKQIVLGLGIGPTTIDLEWNGDQLKFAWMRQQMPEFSGGLTDIDAVAKALGIDAEEIRRTKLPVQQVSCGAPFILVPVATRKAVDAAVLDRAAMGKLIDAAGLIRRGIFVFSTEPGEDQANAYSRMLGFGVVEDPATGNASGPLGSYMVRHKLVTAEAAKHLISRQGVKMGRPSEVHIAIETTGDEITGVRVGGSAVEVAAGTMTLP